MRLRTLTPLALTAIVLAAAGCGSAGAPVRERSAAFTVTLDDYTIRPQELRVPAGRQLTITVANTGRLGHTFRIRAREKNVLSFTTVRPGQRRTRTANLGPGTYTMYCALANHEELGMSGKLTVR